MNAALSFLSAIGPTVDVFPILAGCIAFLGLTQIVSLVIGFFWFRQMHTLYLSCVRHDELAGLKKDLESKFQELFRELRNHGRALGRLEGHESD